MTDREPPKRLGAVPRCSRNSTFAVADRASKPTNQTAGDGRMEEVENAEGAGAENTYGVVLKGGNPFVAASGVTGAAAAKVDIPGGAVELRPDGTCITIRPPRGAP